MDGVGGQTAQPAQGLTPRGQRFGYGAGVTECHLPLPLSTGRAHPAPFSDPQQEVLVLRWSHRRGICAVFLPHSHAHASPPTGVTLPGTHRGDLG